MTVGLALFVSGCAEKDPHRTLRQQLQAPEGGPRILAVYEAWFGDRDHIDVGYSSQDEVVLAKQVEQAQAAGIAGFVVDWYGQKKPFIDRSFALMQGAAATHDFKVALMYDEIVTDPQRMTEDAIAALDYAYEHYISAAAPQGKAYLRYAGHPVIFIWPKGGKTDWSRVRQHVDTWADPPVLIYKDEKSPYADQFDGTYAWIHPGKQGWQKDGSNWGEAYLDDFYARMLRDHSEKITVGAAWPGFDDSKASWSENRFMDRRCGRTLEQTLRYYRRFHNERNPLPYLLIATWNDHEEGTAIERGIATKVDAQRGNCANAD